MSTLVLLTTFGLTRNLLPSYRYHGGCLSGGISAGCSGADSLLRGAVGSAAQTYTQASKPAPAGFSEQKQY